MRALILGAMVGCFSFVACDATKNEVVSGGVVSGGTDDTAVADAGKKAASDSGVDSAITIDAGSDAARVNPTLTGPQAISFETPLSPDKNYRLVLVWFQLSDDGPDPTPEVVVDIPIGSESTGIDLGDLNALAKPSEQNLFCARGGTDEATFPCLSDSPYKFGMSIMAIVEDVNNNGASDVIGKSSADKVALFAWASVIDSPKGGDVLPTKGGETVLIDGTVQKGAFLYESYKPNGATFDRLKPFTSGATLVFKTKAPNWT